MKKYILLFTLPAIMLLMFQACEKENNAQSPSCIITNPPNGQHILKGDIVEIVVEAADTDGSVSEVKVFIDGEEIGSDNVSPYNISWNTSNEELGNKTLKATSFDNNNNQKSDEITVLIVDEGGKPEADFSVSSTTGQAPLTVQFSDESINDPSSWQWDFGDGNTSTSQHPSHVYTLPGVYSVALTVTNPFGSDVLSKASYITVLDANTFIDPRDGQSYRTIEIGSQTWFGENLNFEMNSSWCYDDIPSNCDSYGRLYKWLSARDACPAGWHLPTDDDWKQLEKQIGMSDAQADEAGWRGTDEGKKLKSTTEWISGNGIDDVDFTALPAGRRTPEGEFGAKGLWGLFWTDTPWDTNVAVYRMLSYEEDGIKRFNFSINAAYCVRCVKD